ncbi:hypothetical protein ACFL42_01360 [Candidatus Omnitrophota bacterium]
MRRKILALVLSISIIAAPAYAGRVFDELCAAVEEVEDEEDLLQLNGIEERYKGKFVRGSGYVKKAEDVWGDVVIYASTGINIIRSVEEEDEDTVSFSGADLKIYVQRKFYDQALKFKEGQKVYFFGAFRDIAKKTIIIRNATLAE